MQNAVGNLYSGIGALGNQNYAGDTYGQFNGSGTFAGASGNAGYNPAQTVQYGNDMSSQASQLSPYVAQLFSAGFDPQNDLYGRTAQRLQDQVRAGQAARGIATTPYGAGLEDQAMSNFNLDWNDRQLGRMTQGAQGGIAALGGINNAIGQGQEMAQGVPTWQAQIMQMLQQGGLNANQIPQQTIQNWMGYAGQGQQSANNKYNAQYQNWQAENANDAAMWNGIGSLVGQAASVAAGVPPGMFSFGSSGGGFGK